MDEFLEPGMLVRHPERPDWGLGQVQSVIGGKITVNFEHAGKVVIDGSRISLAPEFGPPAGAQLTIRTDVLKEGKSSAPATFAVPCRPSR